MRSLLLFLIASLSASIPWVRCSAQDMQRPKASHPLVFEPNLGQTAPTVKFLTRHPDYRAFFTESGLTLVMQSEIQRPQSGMFHPTTMSLHWLGAQRGSHFTGDEPLQSYSNYFYGADPAHWQTKVPHYASVTQHDVQAGMDVRFYTGPHGQLEYDIVVAPSLDLSQVKFEVVDADSVRVDSGGDLILRKGNAEFRQHIPLAYEQGGNRKHSVSAHYVLMPHHVVGFTVSGRRPGTKLYIDPALRFSTYLGGSTTNGDSEVAFSTGVSTAVDRVGNVYVTGSTTALDFPTTGSAFEPECPAPGSQAGCASRPVVFVSKFDNAARNLLYSTYLSGNFGTNYFDQAGKLIAVDKNGNAYVTGGAFEHFPVTPNAFQTDCGFTNDTMCAFLTKISADGSTLLYSTYFGRVHGPVGQWSMGNGLALGPQGDAYVVGWAQTSDLHTTPNVFQSTCTTNTGVCNGGFLARFNTNLSGAASLVYATYLGGANPDGTGGSEADGVAVDSAGSAYVTGLVSSSIFPHAAATFGSGTGPNEARGELPIAGSTFVVKLSPDGKSLTYATLLRGASGTSIAVDSVGQAFIAGAAHAGLAVTAGAAQPTFGGGDTDAFVTKLSQNGAALQYSSFIGGSATDVARDVVVNNFGIAFITGQTNSTNFPIRPGAFKRTNAGKTSFVTALQNDGRSLYYSTFLGGSKNTVGNGIAMDPAWNAYVIGTTADTDFPVTPDVFQSLKHGGLSDAFWSKIVITGDLRMTVALTPDSTTVPRYGVVNFRYRVVNLGPDGSDNIAFTDPVIKGWAFAGVYSANANSCSQPPYGATSGTLVCRRTRLEVGQTLYVNVYLRAIAPVGSVLSNLPIVYPQTQDLYFSNNHTDSELVVR